VARISIAGNVPKAMTAGEAVPPALSGCGVEQRNAADEAGNDKRLVPALLSGRRDCDTIRCRCKAQGMDNIEALPRNTRVVAPLGDVLDRGIIVEPPADDLAMKAWCVSNSRPR
jgi:hypothetical protein